MVSIPPATRPSGGGLLAAASRLYGASFLRCVPLALVGALAGGAAGFYVSARVTALAQRFSAVLNTLASADLATPDNATAALAGFVARARALAASPEAWASYLGAALIVLLAHGALIARQNAVLERRTDPWQAPLRQMLRRLPSVLLVLALFAAAAASSVWGLILSRAGGVAALLLVGLAVLTLGLWLWGRLQLWLVAMFAEDIGAVAALGRSWRLVRGHWWHASALTTVPYLVIWAISALAAQSERAASGGLAGYTLTLVAGIVTLPMLPAVWLALYYRLRR